MITATAETFPLRNPFTISRGSKTEARVVTATVTRNGHRGWGEGVPYPRYGETVEEAVAAIAGPARGDHPRRLARANEARCGAQCGGLRAVGPGGEVVRSAGLAVGRAGAAEAGGDRLHPVARHARKRCGQQRRGKAHRAVLKVKLGTPADMPRIEAVRAGAPKVRLIVDANEGWTPEVYTDLAPHLIRLGVEMVEQPLPQGADDMLAEIARPAAGLRR